MRKKRESEGKKTQGEAEQEGREGVKGEEREERR